MKYSIYQLDIKNPTVLEKHKMYESWDFLVKYCGGFNFDEYVNTYNGEVEDLGSTDAVLEKLFEQFNINHPTDFHGHSLSVSDVVILNGNKYYCDSCGWKKL